jgi:prolipoprotein diacylglyceryltransferase
LIASLAIFGWLWFGKSNSPNGLLFLNFVALTAGSRLFLEAYRGDSVLAFGEFRPAQIVAWGVLAVVLFVSESLRRQSKSQ